MDKNDAQSLEEQFAAELMNFWENPDEPETIVAEDERRSRPRSQFPYMQLVAAVRDNRAPAEQDLLRVRCQDISVSGFAYFDVTYPETDQMVVGFGSWPDILYVKAEVVHITPTLLEGEYLFRIGCRYTERLTQAQMHAIEEKVAAQNRGKNA